MGQRVVEPSDAIPSVRPGPIASDDRLGWILEAVDAGITVQDARLRLVFANQEAAELCGWSSPDEMLSASPEATLDRFEIVDESGAPLDPSALPGRRALAGERPEPLVVGFRSRLTNELRWSLVRARLVDAGPVANASSVSTFHRHDRPG